VISMLSSFGIAQVAVLMVVELGYILVIAVKWPFSESSDNKFHLFLGVIRIVITGCGLAYVHEVQASPEVRQLFGYIQMALHLAVFIVVFALAIWNTVQVV
ncbi:MAG: TRP-like family, partial [Podila humilis]